MLAVGCGDGGLLINKLYANSRQEKKIDFWHFLKSVPKQGSAAET